MPVVLIDMKTDLLPPYDIFLLLAIPQALSTMDDEGYRMGRLSENFQVSKYVVTPER